MTPLRGAFGALYSLELSASPLKGLHESSCRQALLRACLINRLFGSRFLSTPHPPSRGVGQPPLIKGGSGQRCRTALCQNVTKPLYVTPQASLRAPDVPQELPGTPDGRQGDFL